MKLNNLLFEKDERIDFQIIPPEKMMVPVDLQCKDKFNFIELSSHEKRLAMENGYEVRPLDCPPIRNINNYGFKLFCPLEASVQFNKKGDYERKFFKTYSQNKYFKISGTKTSFSDSEYIASWLANSRYFKIITGVNIYCPIGYGIFQGSLPLSNQKENENFRVISAIEYGNSYGIFLIEGVKYFKVELNIVCQPLQFKKEFTILKGQEIGVFFPVMKINSLPLLDVKTMKNVNTV